MKTFRAVALVAVVGLAGCDGIFGNDDENFSFESLAISSSEGMTDEAEAVGVIGNLQVDGIMITPHPCLELKGSLSLSGANVEVTVTATATNTGCTGQIQAFQYRLQSFGLPRGVLRISIDHRIGTEPRRLINQQDVAVG